MTSNDAQIDVLLRRFAGQAPASSATEHLDADELSAFAEGSLPDAARARYVSHLVDCDNCRQSVSQLAISSGSVVKAEASRHGEVSGSAWWKRLSGFFPPLTLRYAAFAMVLIAAAGVVFLVMQRQRDPNLIALSSKENRAPETAVKPQAGQMPQPSIASPSSANDNRPGLANNAPPLFQATPSPDSGQIAKLDQPKTGVDSPFGLKSAKEAEPVTNPAVAANKKAAEPTMTETTPSYAPPPPAAEKRAESQSRESNVGGLASASAPRKAEQQPVDKLADRGRGGEAGKDIRNDDNESRQALNQQVARKRVSDEKVKGPRRDQDNLAGNRNSNEISSADAAKPQSVLAPKSAPAEEKAPEIRSVGGRKFKRQGNAWVDAKFKSSMTLKSIARGSSDFESLDSNLRSIAQQLGGEIIVVWKGKAYQIR